MRQILIAILCFFSSNIISANEVRHFSELSYEDMKGLMEENSELIAKFNVGDQFPFKFKTKSNLFELLNGGEENYSVKVKRSFYIKALGNKSLHISLDGKKWVDFTEFGDGDVSLGFIFSRDDGQRGLILDTAYDLYSDD